MFHADIIMVAIYDVTLVVFSVVIAFIASYTALNLDFRLKQTQQL